MKTQNNSELPPKNDNLIIKDTFFHATKEKTSIRIAVIAANSWTMSSLDIKTAFLQGKFIETEVFVKPPKEAESTNLESKKLDLWICRCKSILVPNILRRANKVRCSSFQIRPGDIL